MLEFAFVGVGLGRFEGGGDFGLLGFEFDDLLFEDSDVFAEFADFARAGFGFAGRGGCGDGRGFFDFGLFRAVVGEAGGEGDAGVAGFGFVQEVFVVAGVVGELAAVDVEDVFREGLDEVNVVRDEDERALVFAKGHHECVDRLDVQVRRGLVHEEQVGRADENAGEGKAGFFAAGEDGDGLEDVVFAEEEGAEDGAGLLFGELVFVGAQLHHVFEDRGVGVQVIETVLGEVTGDDVAAEFARAALDGDDAGEDFEERGFAGAVGSDEDDALAALGGEVEVFVNDVVAVGLPDVFELDDLEAGARGLRELEVHLAQLFGRLLDGDILEALDLFFLGLGAGGHGGLGTEAVNEDLQVGDLALLIFEGGELLVFAGFFLGEEVVVVAVVVMERAGAELEHAGAEGVQESTVVGDDDEAAGVACEVVLEPEESFEIEMVRRLVEEEQRGFGDEEAGEVGAHDPAAGEGFGEFVGVVGFETEAVEDFAGAGFEGVVDVVVVIGGLEFFAGGRDVENGLVAGGGGLLREVAEVGAAFPLDGAGVGFFLAEDEAEEGGLAGAVGADEAEAVGAGDEQRDVGKEFAGAVGLRNVCNSQHENGTPKRGRVRRSTPHPRGGADGWTWGFVTY